MTKVRETGPILTTILRDTREQRPWTLSSLSVETCDMTLSTGDYTAPTDCTHDPGQTHISHSSRSNTSPGRTSSPHSRWNETDSPPTYSGSKSDHNPPLSRLPEEPCFAIAAV